MHSADIPPDYYLRNFERVLAAVRPRYDSLLTPNETSVLDRFAALDRDARLVGVRLYLRPAGLVRLARFAYPEIADVAAGLATLVTAGIALVDGEALEAAGVQAALPLLKVGELRGLARALGYMVGADRKAALLERLAETEPPIADVLEIDRFALLRVRKLFDRIEVLFFGNVGQSLNTFVIADLEHVRFASYPLTHEPRLFADRHALDDYILSWHQAELPFAELSDVQLQAEAGNALSALGAATSVAPHAHAVDPGKYRGRAAFELARELERRDYVDWSLAIYPRIVTACPYLSARVKAAERLGILAKTRSKSASAFTAAVDELLADERLDSIAAHRLRKRRARLGLGPHPDALRHAPVLELSFEEAGHRGPKALYRGAGGEPLTVEEAVLERLGGDGVKAENALFRTLFGLLLWEGIWAPIPGVFQQPFQYGPLDLETEAFYPARRDLVDARLEALRTADAGAEVRAAWTAHYGTACQGVAWNRFDVELLARTATGLGAALVPTLERLARHPKRHGKGLPDLLIFHGDGRLRLVEVKGPGDQVRVEQLLWHDRLITWGVDVRLVRVRRVTSRT